MLTKNLADLLDTWEGNYKKGLLTFWMLLILHEREAYAFEMSDLIKEVSKDTIQADEKSVYRALNRFEKLGLVASSWRDSDVGPPRRYYQISKHGLILLQSFIRRNILLFHDADIQERIQKVLNR